MKHEEIYVDPMEEIYVIRRKLSARYGHDVYMLSAAAREWKRKDEANGIHYVSLPIARRQTAKMV